jgi:DNA-binding XRE family transcriptional regulator
LRIANKQGGEIEVFRNLDAEQARFALTNQQVADKLGISRVSYENKKKTGKFTTLEIKELCKLFKSKFDYLFETEDTKAPVQKAGQKEEV